MTVPKKNGPETRTEHRKLFRSSDRNNHSMQGWRLPFEAAVHQVVSPDTVTPPQGDLSENGPEQFIYVDDAGRELKLGGLLPGDSAFYTDEGFRVWRSKRDYFLLQTFLVTGRAGTTWLSVAMRR